MFCRSQVNIVKQQETVLIHITGYTATARHE